MTRVMMILKKLQNLKVMLRILCRVYKKLKKNRKLKMIKNKLQFKLNLINRLNKKKKNQFKSQLNKLKNQLNKLKRQLNKKKVKNKSKQLKNDENWITINEK